MKIDYELLRLLLLQLEGENIDLNKYEEGQILYHKAYLWEKGLADGPKPHYPSTINTEIPDVVLLTKLSPDGHDLIEAIRDAGKWNRVKRWIKKTSQAITLEMIKSALSSIG